MSDEFEKNGIFNESEDGRTQAGENRDRIPAGEESVSHERDTENRRAGEGSIVFDHSGSGIQNDTPTQQPVYRMPTNGSLIHGASNGASPTYSSHISEDGGILYTPADKKTARHLENEKKKRRKAEKKVQRRASRSVNWAAVSVLIIVSVLLATSCGFFGAYAANVVFGGDSADGSAIDSDNGASDPIIIHQSQSSLADASMANGNLKYADVVAKVEDSVVSITTEYKVTSIWGQYVTGGAGSGVIISADGFIVTNNHVICSSDGLTVADTITVKLTNDEEYNATVVGTDATTDIALLKIGAENLTYAEFGDSDTLVVGEEVIAIGNPLGELSGTSTNGIISALAREISVEGVDMNLIQTNAAINPGNSGGGLFNMAGQLIGIVNAKSSGTGIEGLGFAIPANDVINEIAVLKENAGKVSTNTMIGVGLYDVDTSAKASYYGYRSLGVYVVSLEEGYNDDVLEINDRVVAVNGEEITSSNEVIAIVRRADPGNQLEFTVIRQGKAKNVTVTCYESKNDDINFEQ